MQEESAPQFTTLADYLRYQTRDFTAWLGKFGLSLKLHPDVITLCGLVVVIVGAAFAAQGQFVAAGLALLLGMPLDALDGAIARAMNRKGRFGAFFDSTLDRYADGAIFFGIAYYYAARGEMQWFSVAIIAMIGAYAVSYARARAEGLDIGSIKDGLFDRLVRSVIIVAMLLTGWITAGLVLLAIGNHLTALQRIYLVWVATKDDETTR